MYSYLYKCIIKHSGCTWRGGGWPSALAGPTEWSMCLTRQEGVDDWGSLVRIAFAASRGRESQGHSQNSHWWVGEGGSSAQTDRGREWAPGMCIHVFICTYIHIVYVHMYIHINVWVYIHTYPYIGLYIYKHMYTELHSTSIEPTYDSNRLFSISPCRVLAWMVEFVTLRLYIYIHMYAYVYMIYVLQTSSIHVCICM